MSNAGRPRKPSKLKKLTGTFQPSRNPINEIDPPVLTDYLPPVDLNEHGKNEWSRVVNTLKDAGVISELDTTALFAMCNEWGKYKDAEERLRTMGRVFKAPKTGYPMMNPYETISGQSFKRYKEMAVQFGLTPASRNKVSAIQGSSKKEDPFEEAVKMKVAK